MSKINYKKSRPAVALLAVLFIVMVVTVLSFGFIARSDRELACGQNMAVRMRTDCLAYSALEHAKTLLVNPQNADTQAAGYWQGAEQLQIESGDDYYDLSILRSESGPTNRCTYDIQCQAYRKPDVEKIAQSKLTAQLRLDPCIAYWSGMSSSISNRIIVNGDVYCGDNLTNNGTVNGDVFANSLSGVSTGQLYQTSEAGVTFPGLVIGDFTPNYYVDSAAYMSGAVSDCNNTSFAFSPGNPKGVFVCNGDLELSGNVSIDGTLFVNGNLTVMGANNTVTAVKNFPALIVAEKLTVKQSGSLTINGLVQVKAMYVEADAGNITILGGLFALNEGIIVSDTYAGSINITIAPVLSSLKTEPDSVTTVKWTPVGGAFLKVIKRD